MRTETQVMIDLRYFLKQALKSIGQNWEVLQSFQPTKGNYNNPYLLMHRLNNVYIGQLQQNSYDKRKSGQLKVSSFQIDAYKKRLNTDTADTIQGEDVLEFVRNWFMSDVCSKELREKGYNVFRIGNIVSAIFETENDTWQIAPNFTIELAYKQDYGEEVSAITSAEGKLVGI